MSFWEAVIGLEIHAQLWTNRKLFSNTKYGYFNPPNLTVSNFDMAIPGTLPKVNSKCVKLATLAALAFNCTINYHSEFDRKHYFYSDMPSGYQITQQRKPLAKDGFLSFYWAHTFDKDVKMLEKSFAKIDQIHIEQDSGKSIHDLERNMSLIDLNRAGVGLIEIVTDCTFKCGNEAAGFVKELLDCLRDLKVCSGQMAEGALRVDANVSIKPRNSSILGIRAEVKNINSLRGVSKAIEYEIKRQTKILEDGREVINETRFYDPVKNCTLSLRDKEVLQDYRHLAEPNLTVLKLPTEQEKTRFDWSVETLQKSLENFVYPMNRKKVLFYEFGLKYDEFSIILNEKGLYDWMLATANQNAAISSATNEFKVKYLETFGYFTKLLVAPNWLNMTANKLPQFSSKFGQLMKMSTEMIIGNPGVHQVFSHLLDDPDNCDIAQLVHKHDLYLISDPEEVDRIVAEFFVKYPNRSKRKKKMYAFHFYEKLITEKHPQYLEPQILSDTILKHLNS